MLRQPSGDSNPHSNLPFHAAVEDLPKEMAIQEKAKLQLYVDRLEKNVATIINAQKNTNTALLDAANLESR